MRRKSLTQKEVDRVVQLLKETDLHIKVIAERMDCEETLISKINREHGNIRTIHRQKRVVKPKSQSRFDVRYKDVKGGFLL